MFLSPLEQFQIFEFYLIKFTNLTFNFWLIIFFLLFLFYNSKNTIYLYNNKRKLVNLIFNFLKTLFKENIIINRPYLFSYIFFIFLIIIFSNILGLIPFSYTITSSIIFTFFFSISSFININIIGFKIFGLKFFNIFLPNGAPKPIVPFLVIIEFISYNARVFSLAIRLFANMMSGHILLKILAGAIWSLLYLFFPLSLFIIWIPLLVLLIILFLELCIAFLQAYVFVTLLCIYFNESINLH